MGIFDDYKREERKRLEPGNYRVSVVGVEETESKSSGNPMIVVTVKPNGSDIKINHYIVKNQYFNRNMTDFFDSFNVEEGDFNLLGWVGAVGAAHLKEDENGYLKVGWFINQKQAEKLPPWEGKMPERQMVVEGFSSPEPYEEDDLPFN